MYAQLVAAHVGDRGAATSAIEMQNTVLAARIDVEAHNVADLDRRPSQIDAAVEKATERGRTTAAMKPGRRPNARPVPASWMSANGKPVHIFGGPSG